MILSKNIPLYVKTFLNNIRRDFRAGAYAEDYRGLLIRETRMRYPGLVEGLGDLGRGPTRRGEVRVLADADHIIPRSLWAILIPPAWNLPGTPPATPNILSNLFWRTVTCNRGAPSRGEALDHAWINHIKAEAQAGVNPTAHWANRYIQMFLQTKHDEGVNIDIPLDPGRVDQMQGGGDLSAVIAFIQRVRQARPGIGTNELVDLVENEFPHVRIETEGGAPRVEIG
jgi:hypothetical protein